MKLSPALVAAVLLAGHVDAFFWWWKPIVIRPLTIPIKIGGGGGGGGGSSCSCPPPTCPAPDCPNPDCPPNPVWQQRQDDKAKCPGTAVFNKDGSFHSCA